MELGLATALAGFTAVGARLATGEADQEALATSLVWGSLVVLGLLLVALVAAVVAARGDGEPARALRTGGAPTGAL